MNCEHCSKEIKYSGQINDGLAYHEACLSEIEITKKEKLLSHSHNLKGLDSWLINYFNENPVYAKVASEKKYFAILTMYTNDGYTLEELENISHRLIYDRNNEDNCILDYLFQDQEVVDCKIKIKLVNIEK